MESFVCVLNRKAGPGCFTYNHIPSLAGHADPDEAGLQPQRKESHMSKPSIVFSHGIWADGSCFSKLIPTLQAEGHDVIAAQYGLDTLKADDAASIAAIERVASGPVVLVGHSSGGAGITQTGVHP